MAGKTAPQNKVLDLESAVQSWASQEYDKAATRKMKRLKSKNYLQVNVDWSRVKIKDETRWPPLAESPFDETEIDGNSNADKITGAKLQSALADTAANTKASVLFQTVFRNNTAAQQEYTMRTEKTTRSTCTTSMETAYTKGIDMCVTLKTPCEVFEANAGFHREMTLTNSEGQSIEEEITWGVESHINVKQGHIANAMLVVEEKKYNGKFEIISRIHGSVYITFNNAKDNNSLVFAISGNIFNIVKNYLEEQAAMNNPLSQFVELVSPSAVIVRTQGACDFRFGIKQQVLVDQVPIPS